MEMISVNGLVKVTYVRGLVSWLHHTLKESQRKLKGLSTILRTAWMKVNFENAVCFMDN